MACSKSIRLLAGKNTFTRPEVCNTNPLRSPLRVTEHTSPSGSATVRSVSGMPLCEWSTAWPSCSLCRLVTQIRSLSAAFSGERTAKIRKESCRESREPVEPQECRVLPSNQLRGMSWPVVVMHLPRSRCPQLCITKVTKDFQVYSLLMFCPCGAYSRCTIPQE